MDNKRWICKKLDKELIKSIAKDFNISDLCAAILYNRGIISYEDIKLFLYKGSESFYDPFLMKDMDKAVERIKTAIDKQEKITVYGDYDVDGITSTAILVNYLSQFNIPVDYYIPDRMEEGYGVNKEALKKIKETGTDLVITVDAGITAVEEVLYAKQLKLDMIITDHHQCKEQLPEAYAILNPRRPDCNYPFKDLAGVGVTFKLVQALAGKGNWLSIIDEYCDIVCLGTIADVVPLLGENRLIVSKGLEQIKDTKNLGLRALIQLAQLNQKKINTGTVGFAIAPRLNAAGRIGSALRAVELLLTKDQELAVNIANELNEENRQRKETETYILREALNKIEEEYDLTRQKVIVLAGENWHHGIIGIVASRITDRFYRPSILIGLEGEEGKGSGRSIKGFNLFAALTQFKDDLIKFGGHEQAAGLSIRKDKLSLFTEHINSYADQVLTEDDLVPYISIDYTIDVEHLTFDIVKELQVLEPFGMGNPAPVFRICNMTIVELRTLSDNKHLKLYLEKKGVFIDAIGFNLGNKASQFMVGDQVDLVCSITTNYFNGKETIQLHITDIKLSEKKIITNLYYKSFNSYLRDGIIGDVFIDGDIKADIIKTGYDFEDLLEHLENNKKYLVLVNTLQGVFHLKNILEQSEFNQENYKIHFSQVTGNYPVNILVNPSNEFKSDSLIENFSKKYDKIYVYDPFINIKFLDRIAQNNSNIYILFDKKKFEWCEKVFENIVPNRKDFAMVYQYIKTRSIKNIYKDSIWLLIRRIAVNYRVEMNYFKLVKSLEIFKEFNLIDFSLEGDEIEIEIYPHKGNKVNLENSTILSKLKEIEENFKTFKTNFYYKSTQD